MTFHPDEFLKLKGARKLNLLGLRALRELFVLREEHARARDLPPFKVLAPQALVTLATDLPTNLRELEHHLPPGIVRRLGHELLAALARAEQLGPFERVPDLPSRSEEGDLDEVQSELHERLKQWRKQRAQGESLDSALVLNRRVLLRLAELGPRERDALVSVEGLLDWQIELFGDELLTVVRTFQDDLAQGKIELRRRRRG